MLTDTKLRALRPRATVYRVADGQGLCVEVRPTGARLWRYRYRYAGKASMIALGEYPAVTLTDARQRHGEARKVLAAGADPAMHARAKRAAQMQRAANTFAAVAHEWMVPRARKLTPGTVKRERRIVEKDLLPWIGSAAVADVSAPMLLSALRRIVDRGAVETAHRARSMAASIFRYAIATGHTERNPADALTAALPAPTVQHFASITEPPAVADLLRALASYSGHPATMAALKLAPLVFVRPGELRQARWADIDLDAGAWQFIASKTKTPHLVPLSVQAVAILRDLHPLTGQGEFVFPSVRSMRRPMSENTITAALRAMGFDGGTMTAHGFRAMARTILDERLGFRPDYIEHQLAHAVRDPLGRAYNRTAHLAERRKMMQAWADYLDSLRDGANVVALKGRKAG